MQRRGAAAQSAEAAIRSFLEQTWTQVHGSKWFLETWRRRADDWLQPAPGPHGGCRQVNSIVHRPVGSVEELMEVQERVYERPEVGQPKVLKAPVLQLLCY